MFQNLAKLKYEEHYLDVEKSRDMDPIDSLVGCRGRYGALSLLGFYLASEEFNFAFFHVPRENKRKDHKIKFVIHIGLKRYGSYR
ncbi:hypothetical protein NPIL_482001 [Nephila pilipes]|uniref:Uncharacterized protein n=1 Tax=Nephila pilipes TaxID=299642 RepID=A0A8X6IL27_NEPPI|nr:hypothetical protein NPIL_482001 [Nephila pilipes]